MKQEIIGLHYDGGLATFGALDVYDYGRSLSGFVRTATILAHYYRTGKIIHRAPASDVHFTIQAAEDGSFKQLMATTVVAGICASPFSSFFGHVFDSWLPPHDTKLEMILAEERKQTELLRKYLYQEKLKAGKSEDDLISEAFIKERQPEIDVLRSITSNSFVDIFRPVDRSCEYMYPLYTNKEKTGQKLVTPRNVGMIQNDRLDEKIRTINAKVTGFTRSTKRGICFIGDMNRGVSFEYRGKESNLPVRDIFSWSQYEQKDIVLEGNFVYFFDGTIKKFIVYYAQKKQVS